MCAPRFVGAGSTATQTTTNCLACPRATASGRRRRPPSSRPRFAPSRSSGTPTATWGAPDARSNSSHKTARRLAPRPLPMLILLSDPEPWAQAAGGAAGRVRRALPEAARGARPASQEARAMTLAHLTCTCHRMSRLFESNGHHKTLFTCEGWKCAHFSQTLEIDSSRASGSRPWGCRSLGCCLRRCSSRLGGTTLC